MGRIHQPKVKIMKYYLCHWMFCISITVESPACVTPKFICNDVIARLAKWRVLATTGVCASARIELKRQRFVVIGVTDLCGKLVLEFGKLCR